MSDLENELLGLVEGAPRGSKKNGKKTKAQSKEYIEDSDDSDGEADMDLESEEGEGDTFSAPKPVPSAAPRVRTAVKGSSNPYPLEGKYLDEADRDQLEDLPEIEREAILAGRLEEMQKFKDSQQLEAMYRQAGMAEDEEEDVDSDEPSRKKRKHTSVSKAASRAMQDLKSKRRAGGERVARRALRRERKQRSASGSEAPSEDEEGEISQTTPSIRDKDNLGYSPSDDYVPASKQAKPTPKKGDADKELDALPPNAQELNSARLSRYEIVDIMFKDGWEEVAVGAYVRLMAQEPDHQGRPKYRVHKIEEISDSKHGRYSIEHQGKQVSSDRALLCSYGKAKRLFRIADLSNGDVEETEFQRFSATNQADQVRPPKRSDLKRKHEAIKALRERGMENIDRSVAAKSQSNAGRQRHRQIIEISSLIASRNLALRRNDSHTVEDLNRQIIALGGDPVTGELISSSEDKEKNISEYDKRIELINERAKRKTMEKMERAHADQVARKRAEEAIVKARQMKSHTNSPAPPDLTKAVNLPASGLRKGETPQQFVARTIDLDLGDF